MKLIRRSDVQERKTSEATIVSEYATGDKDINVAVIKMSGRYPSAGRVMNEKCKELGFVMEGSGKIVVEGEEILLQEGDLISIEPGEKYFWDAHATLLVPTVPAWYPEQHKAVE